MIKELVQDDKAQARAGIVLVVTLMVAAVVASVLLPTAINQIEGNTTEVATQDNGTVYQVNGELDSTVTDVDTSGTTHNVTVELNDTRTAGTTTKTIDNGSTADYSLQGGTVTVGVQDADTSTTPDQATLNYTYDKEYAYSSGASSVWNILGLVIVLGVFLYFISKATSAFN